MAKDTCDIKCINENHVKKVKAIMPDNSTFVRTSDFFKSLGDATRLKLLFALSKEELCVCDLSSLLGIEQSAISHQLRILRNMNIVKYRKDGKIVYYSITENHVKKLLTLFLKYLKREDSE